MEPHSHSTEPHESSQATTIYSTELSSSCYRPPSHHRFPHANIHTHQRTHTERIFIYNLRCMHFNHTTLFVCTFIYTVNIYMRVCVCEVLGSTYKKSSDPWQSLMKCLPKFRVPCDQHSSRAQTQSNLSISGLVAQRPTPTQDIRRKHS